MLQLGAAERARLRRRKPIGLDLREELLLPRGQLLAQRVHVEPSLPRLGEQAFPRLLFLADVMLDLFGEHLDLGVVELLVRPARFDLGDHHLGPVVFDIGFGQEVLVRLALAGRVEDFFLDDGVHRQLGADLLGQRFLLGFALGGFKLLE